MKNYIKNWLVKFLGIDLILSRISEAEEMSQHAFNRATFALNTQMDTIVKEVEKDFNRSVKKVKAGKIKEPKSSKITKSKAK